MKSLLSFLVLIALLKFSSQSICTGYESTSPTTSDIRKITRKIQKQGPPTLIDFGIDQNIGNEGVCNQDPRIIAQELFHENGLFFEEHTVKTQDGYHLGLHRIPDSGNIVLLSHGLFASSLDWLTPGNNSLPYLLSANGYDVWMTNARGNAFSNRHEHLSPDCIEFWDFTFDEIGLYDLPATIDYILETTGQSKLTYIGHSQGTTEFFVMASSLPYYKNKISSAIALAPMAWMSNIKSPLLRVLALNDEVKRAILNSIGEYVFEPNEMLTNSLGEILCGNSTSVLCSRLPFLICGFDRQNFDVSVLPYITRQVPAGVSSKLLIHYTQVVSSGQFRKYDYDDISTNINKYGYLNPPNYDVDSIDVKVSIFYSKDDWVSSDVDVKKLLENLANPGDEVCVEDYNHFDYLWSANVKEEVNDKVLVLIDKYMS